MTALDDLPTPCLLLDRPRLERNLARMTQRVAELGVAFRPHLKTAKSANIASLVQAQAGRHAGITVSTVREAEYFAAHGARDILYAVGIAAPKLDRLAAVQAGGARVTLLADSVAAVRAADERAAALGAGFDLLLEIDCGEGRAGIPPESEVLLDVARAVEEASALRLIGVLTHAGHSYACRTPAAVAEVAEGERAAAVRAAERLRDAGYPCPVVSVGSTPTALLGGRRDGVTEIRAGVYMFGDLSQVELGTCALDDIAVSVLATVISHRPELNTLLIDAGGLALSKDLGTRLGPDETGYGLLADAATGAMLPGLRVSRVYQEHGVVTSDAPLPYLRLPIGARVRVLPNHSCMTGAMYEAYHVTDGGAAVVATWPRVNGW